MFSPYSIHSSEGAEGVKICGPAFTVKMVEASDKTSPSPNEHFVDAAPEGHVIVITAPSRTSQIKNSLDFKSYILTLDSNWVKI